MLQTLTIDSPLKNAMAKGIDGGMSAKAVTENMQYVFINKHTKARLFLFAHYISSPLSFNTFWNQ